MVNILAFILNNLHLIIFMLNSNLEGGQIDAFDLLDAGDGPLVLLLRLAHAREERLEEGTLLRGGRLRQLR